jgi:hypothetical protein
MNEINTSDSVQLGIFDRIMNVFIAPRQTFLSIDQKPDWLIPMIIVVLVVLVFTMLILPISLPEQLDKARIKQEEKGLSPDEIDRAREIGKKFGKIAGPIFAVIGTILYLLALSGIFMFIGNFVLGGQTTYPKILSVISYTSLIGSLSSLLLLTMILTKKTINVSFSLAAFLPADAFDSFKYHLLSKIDLFAIWQIIVAGIGFSVIYKFSTKKATIMVASVYLIYAIISLILVSVFK